MKTKFIKYIICLFSIIFIVASPALLVSASQKSSNTFIMSCGRPAVGNGKGYVEFLLKNRETGAYNVRVVSWCAYPIRYAAYDYLYDNLSDIAPHIYFSTSNTEDYLRITSGNLDDFQWGIYSVNSWSQAFDVYTLTEENNNVYFRTSTNEIVSFHIYGSYFLRSRGGVENEEFYVLYAEDGAIYNAIQNGQQSQTNQIIQGQQQQTDDITSNQDSNTNKITANQNSNANKINANQDKNTDKLINAGSNVNQPDFGSANNSLDSTTNQMNSIEGSYKIDKNATQNSLNEGKNFIVGTDMQRASIQVKNWIEKFASDNIVISGFLVSCMVLGVCFWVIGRKSW